MGSLMFGKDETLTCVQSVTLKGANDEALCLAFKTSKYFVGGGVALKDDGYVLRSLVSPDTYDRMPDGAEQKAVQARGLWTDEVREAIIVAVEDDCLLTFALNDGTARTTLVAPQEKHFSNQRALIRDVPRIFGKGRALEAQPQVIA